MKKKMTFLDLYQEEKKKPTAAQTFVADISQLTHRSTNTIRMWISGRQKPDELAKSILAERFGTDMETLFPDK